MPKEKKRYAKKGDKIKIVECPNCKEEVIIDMGKGESEIFECTNCKFKIKKK